jgi:DNA-directed RNA polymerase specialized sigma24 family protein
LTVDPSVTHWIAGLKAGNAVAAQRLWDGYFQRLIALARSHLGVVACGGADEEDVAQSVFKSLCLGAERGKFPQLSDRHNLWTLLVAMTAYKSRDLIRRERSAKRGSGRVLDEAALAAGDEPLGALDDFVGREPTPQFAAQVAEQCRSLLALLTPVERRTAELKLQAFTSQEIAERMDCGLRTVERRLSAVRRVWTKDT